MIRINLKIRTAVAVAALAVLFDCRGSRFRFRPGCPHQLHARNRFQQIPDLQMGSVRVPPIPIRSWTRRSSSPSTSSSRPKVSPRPMPTPPSHIGYQVSLNQETQWNAYGAGASGGAAAWPRRNSPPSPSARSCSICTIPPKRLVWTGRASKTLNPANQTKETKKSRQGHEKALEEFPAASQVARRLHHLDPRSLIEYGTVRGYRAFYLPSVSRRLRRRRLRCARSRARNAGARRR